MKSQHDGVLHRTPVVPRPPPYLSEASSGVQGPRAGIRLPHFQENLAGAALGEHGDHTLHERTPDAMPAPYRGDGQVQYLALVGGVHGDHVAGDAARRLGYEEHDLRRRTLAEIAERPGVREDRLLDRVHGGDIGRLSGSNAGGGVRGGSPI